MRKVELNVAGAGVRAQVFPERGIYSAQGHNYQQEAE